MPNLSAKETKAKFNTLYNDPSFKLIKGNSGFIFYIKNYTTNGENLRKSLLI